MLCDCCNQEYDHLNDLIGYCDACSELMNACEDALSIARRIGVSKYGPSSWRDVPIQEHLEHALIHVQIEINKRVFNIKDDTSGNVSKGEDHIAHAICRLVMARALIS